MKEGVQGRAMSRELDARLGGVIAGVGALATAAAYAVSGAYGAWSAAAGAVLAFANFHAWRWLVGRIVGQRLGSKSGLGLLLVVKLMVGLGAVFVFLGARVVAPLPFLAGLASLVVGIVFGSAVLIALGPAVEGEG